MVHTNYKIAQRSDGIPNYKSHVKVAITDDDINESVNKWYTGQLHLKMEDFITTTIFLLVHSSCN